MTYYEEHLHYFETLQKNKNKTGSSTVRREGWMNEMRALTYQRVSDP